MDKNARNPPDQLKHQLHRFSQELLWKIKLREPCPIRTFENAIPYLQKAVSSQLPSWVHLARDKSGWQTSVKKETSKYWHFKHCLLSEDEQQWSKDNQPALSMPI